MNIRRKNRLWIACAVLAGLALTIGLVLYALRAKHDENYTPPEVEKAMEANHRRPASVYKDPAS